MAKAPTPDYVCSNCSYRSARWLGKCPQCGQFGTLEQQAPAPAATVASLPRGRSSGAALQPFAMGDVQRLQYVSTGNAEVDLVLGGGVVPGAVLLVTGEPGIGKSTLLAQLAAHYGAAVPVHYYTGEETGDAVHHRVERLCGSVPAGLRIYPTHDIGNILATAESAVQEGQRPLLAIIDSVQTVFSPDIDSSLGAASQVRAVAESALRLAKRTGIAVVLVGHVTKTGDIAGPKALEHLVDVVMGIEGDRYYDVRLLRTVKNRYGPTTETGVLQMTETGLQPLPELSFVEGEGQPGSCHTIVLEGSRPFLAEVQALTARRAFGYPQRTAVGVETSRLQLLLAVAERHLGVDLSEHDVFVKLAGGLTSRDPALDLAILAAVLSAASGQALPAGHAVLGEVGLTGVVRAPSSLAQRLAAAKRMQLGTVITAAGKKKEAGTLHTLGELPAALGLGVGRRGAKKKAIPEGASEEGKYHRSRGEVPEPVDSKRLH